MVQMEPSFRKLVLIFDRGSLLLEGCGEDEEVGPLGEYFLWDSRVSRWRAAGSDYRDIVLMCINLGLVLEDRARDYQKTTFSLKRSIVPRRHQSEALKAWIAAEKRGVVSLPTGAGKTILAILTIEQVLRPTLVVVPTIDLLNQWQGQLEGFFGMAIGVLGGGRKTLAPITVATYDSAALMMGQIGNQFGYLIFDECHHLPSPMYSLIANAGIAPFRLGLSATVERPDGKEELIYKMLGPLVYYGQINDMVEGVLAPYDVVTIEVPLTDEEMREYQHSRNLYLSFIRQNRIHVGSPQGWGEFIKLASYLPGGRDALLGHLRQKQLAQSASGKIEQVWKLLNDHRTDRVIIFTNDNELAYQIGRLFVLPVLTHKTKKEERAEFLSKFRDGVYRVLVTSKVLNEGVDCPEAGVAIIVSGSSGVREHVQRLGRILRHQPGKRAILYELISRDTSETNVKERRRQHHAYQRPD